MFDVSEGSFDASACYYRRGYKKRSIELLTRPLCKPEPVNLTVTIFRCSGSGRRAEAGLPSNVETPHVPSAPQFADSVGRGRMRPIWEEVISRTTDDHRHS